MKKRRSKSADKKGPNRVEPTQYELATLAVAVSQATTLDNIRYVLSHGGGNIEWATSSDEISVKKALALWLTAGEIWEKWLANPASVFPPKPAPTPGRPEPKRYPVKLDEFLKFMLPHLSGRTGEKYGLFREYLVFRLRNPTPPAMMWDLEHSRLYAKTAPAFDCCNPRIVPAFVDLSTGESNPLKPTEPTKEDVDRYFAVWQAKPIPDHDSFRYHQKWFHDWYQTKHAVGSRAAKAENAFKRHAKERLRKHLWEKSTKSNPKNKVPFTDFPEITGEQMARLLELNKGKPVKDYKHWSYDIDTTK